MNSDQSAQSEAAAATAPSAASSGKSPRIRTMLGDLMSGFIKANADAPGRYSPRLISNRSGSTMGDALRSELEKSDGFDISVAFVNENTLKSLYQAFLDQNENQGNDHPSRIITSTKSYFNDPKAFKELMKLKKETGVDVRIWGWKASEDGNRGDDPGFDGDVPFHPKGYLFARRMEDGKPYYDLYVGSSNLTGSALGGQREWNLRVSSTGQADLIAQVKSELEAQVSESIPLTDDWIREYEEDFERHIPPREQLLAQARKKRIVPNAMQREALANLKELRRAGKRKAIVISATGTGKTYLSALDVKACHPRRMLYVAPRAEILESARAAYQRVLGGDDSQFGRLYGGTRECDTKYVFATANSLLINLRHYHPDDFDYVLIDEVHHAGADSYKKIIEYFSGAEFMLGMTATPERTDDFDIFELFDHTVAYEIRLQKALDENMLCPFHYYGVTEYLGKDGNEAIAVDDDATSKDKEQIQYEIGQLASLGRVRYIIDNLEKYGSYDQPVTGLVFCSSIHEARALSQQFNQQLNQQAERDYRTRAVSGEDSQDYRDESIRKLENGELDYLFTVDLFNEGIDIPSINQIVMLRNTQSSIVFTQQLGRGLRKFPHKSCVTVIDFIGNYTNNYLIPVALYGNAGDRDTARRNMQRASIGLSSISFDEISRERVLRSLDTANWSDMRRLHDEYRRLRHELDRVPMLTDVYAHDPSLVVTMATKKGSYFMLAKQWETPVKGASARGIRRYGQLQDVSETGEALLKMATEILVPALRPQELVILDELAGFSNEAVAGTGQSASAPREMSTASLRSRIRSRFPRVYDTDSQMRSALAILDGSFFDSTTSSRYGKTPLIVAGTDDSVRLSPAFAAMLASSEAFRAFFGDCVRVGLLRCRDLFEELSRSGRSLADDHGFVYQHKYKIAEVERLLAWSSQVNGQNVGGYKVDRETGTMPIFVKYGISQYEDRFVSQQEMLWHSKNKRTLASPEFSGFLLAERGWASWGLDHFVPVFVMRRAEAQERLYYYVGHVVSFTDPKPAVKLDTSGTHRVSIVTTNLKLDRPVDEELFRHLTGRSAL